MKKKFIFHLLIMIVMLFLFITVSYAWFIESAVGNKVTIRSANISSKITLYQGQDFNYDGNLDLDDEGLDIFYEVEKNDENVLVLDFGKTYPTKVHTWKIDILNQGDATGYVYATLHEDIFNNDSQYKFVKYMSISSNGNKIFLGTATQYSILIGGTTEDKIEIQQSKEYIFQIEIESFDNLVENGICTESDYTEYQSLQENSSSISFEFLNVSLTSSLSEIYQKNVTR